MSHLQLPAYLSVRLALNHLKSVSCLELNTSFRGQPPSATKVSQIRSPAAGRCKHCRQDIHGAAPQPRTSGVGGRSRSREGAGSGVEADGSCQEAVQHLRCFDLLDVCGLQDVFRFFFRNTWVLWWITTLPEQESQRDKVRCRLSIPTATTLLIEVAPIEQEATLVIVACDSSKLALP